MELIGMYIVPALVLCAASYGLEPSEFKAMLRFGVPIALFNVLYVLHHRYIQSGDPNATPYLDFIEFFSGAGQICNAMVRAGFNAQGYDVLDDGVFEHFIGAQGFLCAIKMMMLLRKHGGNHWGTVCSSWVWLCRSTSKRSVAFPLGMPPQCKSVLAGNEMVSNMCLLLLWSVS